MVIYNTETLDRTFAALADPTRRAIVERLADGSRLAISELAAPFRMSLPAVLKHVGVLGEAGLIAREKVGRTVYCRLEATPMRDALQWLERYEEFWSGKLDQLARFVEAEEDETCLPPKRSVKRGAKAPAKAASKRRASRSVASSKPPPQGSGARGRGRKR